MPLSSSGSTRLTRRGLLAALAGAPLARAQPPGAAREPEALAGFLPPFTATPFDAPPAAGGWGPALLSPTGRFFLIERLQHDRRTVHVLDQDGEVLRGYASPDCAFSAARWGPTDAAIYQECRASPRGAPRYVRVERTSDRERPSRIRGLPIWAWGGQDYVLPIEPRPRTPGASLYRRYRADNVRVGDPLGVAEPVWSPDGRSLAFLTERPRPAGATEEEFPPLREVRALPARGTVPRVVLSRAGWTKLMEDRGWLWARGPDALAWSPEGDALFGLCLARTGDEEVRFFLRMDLKTPDRQTSLVGDATRWVSVSADGRHWLLEMDTGAYRLAFKPRGR